jgi:hypothetical protein
MRTRAPLGLCVIALCATWLATPASADVFGSISLLSNSPFEQYQYAHDPVISADGRYLVFDGSIGGVTGVWRRENRPGAEPEQVAGGDARLPSVSQNGQYISFTSNEGASLEAITNERPAAAPEHYEPPNVYVRNMSVAANATAAFTLVSAKDHSSEALAYEETTEEQQAGEYGSVAAGRSAISANGREVAFVTTAPSDLAGAGTPALQVAVRNLDTLQTQLVSVRYDPATGASAVDEVTGAPEPVPGGAVFTGTGKPLPFQRPPTYQLPAGIGASISAQGTTVAWMGQRVGQQVRLLAGESESPSNSNGTEGAPLWRRIANGPSEPTRAVTGGPDPENPACAAHPENALPLPGSLSDPCQGPFESLRVFNQTAILTDAVPQLSADGYTVAFIADAKLIAQGTGGGGGSNVYVADMHPGQSQTAALRQLTEVATGGETVAYGGHVNDLAISPDGTQVAFTTMRTVFPLGTVTYTSTTAAVPGLAELFDVDLANDTLTRVTHGYQGGPAEHFHQEYATYEDSYDALFGEDDGAASPSFSEDGNLLAFASTASNLVYGDGNTPPGQNKSQESDGADVFAVSRLQFAPNPAPQVISAAPAQPSTTPLWMLGVTSASAPAGRVLLYVAVPGAGQLSAAAQGEVELSSAGTARKARTHRAHRSHVSSRTVVARTVAAASRSVEAGAEGAPTTLTLTLAPRYRALAAGPGGLAATVTVTFAAPGHPPLRQSIAVVFRYPPAKAAARRVRASRRARHGSSHSSRRAAS